MTVLCTMFFPTAFSTMQSVGRGLPGVPSFCSPHPPVSHSPIQAPRNLPLIILMIFQAVTVFSQAASPRPAQNPMPVQVLPSQKAVEFVWSQVDLGLSLRSAPY